ncbi:efflux RND transporter periplasmic adaptor subunit [Flavobacterium hercynium]|uniref:Efflux transporter periplasmic adaptor subunit n=1 Tax=Flavobacterium hercynium TaxID=387094 RepID=A0A226HIA0_9FLAO|nr:efflux RND transporter periplasmic adaptor subunit [Flavobacterium hercynium]OXA93396.1 efflux transporter periplasmic adaptor subunit [Flavobacterium hercynium]SMP35743.1 RND family efflux transporter, MFP subunit [Flavobacterium hercynium]
MNKSKFTPFTLLGSLLVFLVVCSCNSKVDLKEVAAIPVSIQHIKLDDSAYQQEYIGTVESDKTVEVSFILPGTIEQVLVNEGQRVIKGQLLAKLNTTSVKNAHDVSVATLKQAEDAYKRLSSMYEQRSLPEIQFIDVKTKLEQARAGEEITRKNLEQCAIYAPLTGVIGKKYFEAGANVMPGSPVFTVMDIANVKIKAAIPEREISNLYEGSKAKVIVSALDNTPFQGILTEKGVSANPVSHTYDIKIRVKNPSGKIVPGMVCRTYLGSGDSKSTIIVPLRSVQVDYSGKRFVWLKDKNDKAVYREVKLGNLSQNGVQVNSGLVEGDLLITAGYQNISEGTIVKANY